jgi:hypothetical protein
MMSNRFRYSRNTQSGKKHGIMLMQNGKLYHGSRSLVKKILSKPSWGEPT